MKKIVELISALKTFLGEVKTELKKCTWPTRSELMGSTMVVVISVVILGAFVGLSDSVLMGILRAVLR
ncbi:preprotein translocase subunit SecE [Tichowtungia aerotolerans]|uniref:Protein translocase subunit SecE n=1 Tax=Tichowtungia aerotolerans TaxID=2697043 RepID=A0A6P1M8J3_9BACT|nr:preprotein translocase subunit SecE [Tichowtungia aerotolerans]QHI68438.1 preprotein translocase subunit SecE [Tichowtungia aerotolerans]